VQLGGAPPRAVDTTRLAPRTPSALTPLQRANEMAVPNAAAGTDSRKNLVPVPVTLEV
jgi:hypothetical protein